MTDPASLPDSPQPASRWRQLTYLTSGLFAVVLFGLSMWAIQQELQKYRLQDIEQSILTLPSGALWSAIGLTVLNYIMLTGYDTLAVRFARHPLPYYQTAWVATISYGISNTVGFSLLSSSAIRYRFYAAWGLSARKIAQIIAFCHLSFWVGLFAVGAWVFLVEPLEIPHLLQLPFNSAQSIGVLFLAIVLAYLGWNLLPHPSIRVYKWQLPHLSFPLSLAQLAVTSLGWITAAATLYVLLADTLSLSFSSFFAVYLLAQLSSIFSNVPGGLGVFETVLLFLLSPAIDSATLLGALLAYRCIHYFLPLGIATVLLGGYELRQRFASASLQQDSSTHPAQVMENQEQPEVS